MIVDLFMDFRDGSRLLDLLEVMSGQRLVSRYSAPRRRGLAQCSKAAGLTLVFCSAESGERQGNVPAQEQHRKGPFLSEAEISESHWVDALTRHEFICDRKFGNTRLLLRCLLV